MLSTILFLICLQLIQGKSLEQVRENDGRPLCPCEGKSDYESIELRVVGGHAVGRRGFPYAVGLVFGFPGTDFPVFPFCGGTLITDRHVVTAAHCLKNKVPGDFLVDVGDYSLRDKTEGALIPVRNFTKFWKYRPNVFHMDIGIVELEVPVSFDSGIRTAILPNRDLELKPGTTVTVYGWGRLSYDGDSPDKLNAVELPVMDNKECRPKFKTTIESNMICAGGVEGKDACIGDSGSGLVVRLDNQYVLCGLVSFGRRCALPHVPGVYTRISSYVDWIQDNTKSAGCRPCIYGEDK